MDGRKRIKLREGLGTETITHYFNFRLTSYANVRGEFLAHSCSKWLRVLRILKNAVFVPKGLKR